MTDQIPWWWLPLVVIDTETTGWGSADRIVQIGIVSVDRGEITERWESLINPGRKIPAEVSALHGITDEKVADSPTFEAIQDKLVTLCRGAVPVAYNYHFDKRFIHREWTGEIPPSCPALDPTWEVWIDPHRWERKIGGRRPKGYYKLTNVAKRRGIETEGSAHTALTDAMMTFDLLHVPIHYGPRTLPEFLAEQAGSGRPNGNDSKIGGPV